jgi:methionyl-tRNA formyltransferase
VGFAGTPEFAARALDALHHAGYTIPIVLTRADRPSGRGLRIVESPVARLAAAYGLEVAKPPSLRDAATVAALTAIEVDILVVAAYGMIVPPGVLAWPAHGCLNIHASLLPRWRGAAPIARAIEAGDRESGITVMQMDAGLDTGPIVARRSIAITPRETAGSLHDRLAELGGELIVEVIGALAREGCIAATPQPVEGVTWAAKLGAADEVIDWNEAPAALDRRIRALTPSPGAVTRWQRSPLKVLEAEPVAREAEPVATDAGSPGSVLRVAGEGIDVACGPEAARGALRLVRVQPAGGRAMPASAFAAGRHIVRGALFG